MAQSSPDASWNPLSPFLAEYSFLVNCISFACLGLGLVFLVPLLFLIVMDFFLWIWRVYWSNSSVPARETKQSTVTDETPASATSTGIDKRPIRS